VYDVMLGVVSEEEIGIGTRNRGISR
jgi:hypothetical protein